MRQTEFAVRRLLGVCVVAMACLESAFGADMPAEQRRLFVLRSMPLDDQRAPTNQKFLQDFVRRGALLYMHRLDALTCRDLFSLGDEALFLGAVGNSDGSDRNQVLIYDRLKGKENSPCHLDGSHYCFPADTYDKYWPLSSDRSTYWHEVQHALLETRLGLDERPYKKSLKEGASGTAGADPNHPFIEGVGERGSEAYQKLLAFEEYVRKADLAEAQLLAEGQPVDYARQRQVWSDAHLCFVEFLKAMDLVANIPAAELGKYRTLTGIFFSSAEQVGEFYRSGGLKRLEHGEHLPIKPPAWVFYRDLLLKPVHLQLTDAKGNRLELPPATGTARFEIKDDVYRQEFRVDVRERGTSARLREGNMQISAPRVKRGRLAIKLQENDPLARLVVTRANGQEAGSSGRATHLIQVDLDGDDIQPVSVLFVRRNVSQLMASTTYHVDIEFSEGGQNPVYEAASAQVVMTLASGTAAGSTKQKPPDAAPPAADAGAAPKLETVPPVVGKEKLGVTMRWGPLPAEMTAFSGSMHDERAGPRFKLPAFGEREVTQGAMLYFRRKDMRMMGDDYLVVEVYGVKRTKPYTLADHEAVFQEQKASNYVHEETTLAGRRAYHSYPRGAKDGPAGNRHYYIELDAKRMIWLSVLSELKVSTGSDSERERMREELERNRMSVIASLVFGGESAETTVARPAEKPLPKPFTEAPIAENELLPRPPPPEPPADTAGRSRSVDFVAPGGYSIRLPSDWTKGGAEACSQMFFSPDRLYILACPATKTEAPEDFESFCGKLSAQWKRRGSGIQTESKTCGAFSVLIVKTRQDDRPAWHAYVGRDRRVYEFRILGAPGTKCFPVELLSAFGRLKEAGQ